METKIHIAKGESVIFPASRHWWAGAMIFVLFFVAGDVLLNGGISVWELIDPIAHGIVQGKTNVDGTEIDISWLSMVVNRVISDTSMGVFGVVLFYQFYKKKIWKYDKALGIPVLGSDYSGTLEYYDKHGDRTWKKCDIRVDQEIDSVQMTLYTSEAQSTTLVGKFVEECGEPVLYYVYRARPLGFDKEGLSKLGAAALFLNVNRGLEGQYWTSDGRRGKLYFRDVVFGKKKLDESSKPKKRTQRRKNIRKCAAHIQSSRGDNVNAVLGLFRELEKRIDDDFSGVGIVIHDESFDRRRCVSLRPSDNESNRVSLMDPCAIDYLKKVSSKRNPGHDGCILVNSDCAIEACSQYLCPPFPCELRPDYHRGTRSFSAFAGSLLNGVILTGVMSEDGSYAIYENGNIVYDSSCVSDLS